MRKTPLDSLPLGDLDPSPEHIALVRQEVENLEKRRIFLTGVLQALEQAAGIAPTTITQNPEKPVTAPQLRVACGSLASLVEHYRTDEHSPYHNLRFRTRENYNSLLKRIIDDHGDQKLDELKAQDIRRFHEGWTERGMSMARSLVTMLRMLFGFGATILEDPQCERLAGVLRNIRLKMIKPRNELLTAKQADDIRAMAHKMGRPSIALAQALQFDCKLRQKDVIGEWVPSSEPGKSDVRDSNRKWLRGIQWSEIDENLILRHTTSFGQKDIEVDLKQAPMVVEELSRLRTHPPAGAVIVCEATGVPWTTPEFRRWWRKVADACGIPKAVRNTSKAADAAASNGEKYAQPRYGSPKHGEESEKERTTEDLLSVARH